MLLPTIRCASFIIASLLLVVSCGKKSSNSPMPDSGKLGDTEFVIQNSSTLTFATEGMSGSGQVLARLPADELAGEKNFALSFTLQEGGSLTLGAFTTNTLVNGIQLKFERNANALKVSVSKGSVSIDVSSKFSSINASGLISVLVDVHNGESPAHVIAWSTNIENPSASNADYESERDEDLGTIPGQGEGTYWGLILKNAKVSKADAGATRFED
jgi:hypothetical protein